MGTHEGDNADFSRSLEGSIYSISPSYDMKFVARIIKNSLGLPDNRKCHDYLYKRSSPCPWCKDHEVFVTPSDRWYIYDPQSKAVKKTAGGVQEAQSGSPEA